MPIDNQLWCARFGIYNSNHLHHFTCLKINPANLDICIILKFSDFYMITVYLILLTYLLFYLFLTQLHNYGFNINTINFLLFNYFDFCCYALNLKCMLLLESGDIEANPGPRKSFIKFCHWNLNGLAAHDFVKMPLLEAFIKTHNFDIICLSETFLDSSIDINDTRININGYSLLRADHPSNTKRGGVCMYYRNYLPIIRRTDLSDLEECTVAEVTVDKERRFLTSLQRSPSRNDDEFETFCSNLNFVLNNINKFQPLCSVLLGDFNAKHSKWSYTDKSNKPEDPSIAPKTYWSILNSFLNNKKLPIIPPILVDDRVVSNFTEKTKLFNSYFASQCTPVTNKSQLPSLEFKTRKRIEEITFTDDDINLIIKNLNVDKAYGWDNISIRMIKLCGKSITRPLSLIFWSILNDGVFPDDWEKSNTVSCHKKDSKNLTKNYWPISFLPIFSKVFERLIYNSLYN